MVVNKTVKQIVAVLILAAILRFYHLGSNPPSPYWEEAAIGYDAYSVLKTGKDFHGNAWPLVAFESFGDYKPSLYFYATVPSIAVFGLNTFAVRFPSALFGTLTVLLVYFLVKDRRVGLLVALLLAVSPWHLQFSRAGFEANLGLFLVVLGVWLLLKNKILAGAISFAACLYSYHADRIFVPLLLIVLFFIFRQKKVFFTGVLVILLALPLAVKLNSPQIRQRFNETSAFSTLEPIIKSNQLIAADGGGLLPRIIHHRYWQYGRIFLTNYFSHFNFNYLFISGDANPRHSIQTVGGLYLIQLPFLLYGVLLSLKKRTTEDLVLLSWLFLAPVPAALTLAAPHALRSLALLVPLTIFTARGLINSRKLLIYGAILILILETGRYLKAYYQIYPRQWAGEWQYGYQEMVGYVADNEGKYDHIYITRSLGRPSIYYWFYTKTDPQLVQAANTKVKKDQGEYLEFGKINFSLPEGEPAAKSLVVTAAQEASPAKARLVKEIDDFNGQVIFKFYEI
ncbi:MAG: glycosyltransferase family 39 protein [Candidatus Beckwithbacteria bacterium]|nr:glycosyltransferase family 39 protein [Candidatus Beckwithbacteria bacterium]